MKYLELLKFPTHKASLSFHFSSSFYSLNSLLSFPTLKYIHYYGNSDISGVGEAKWDTYQSSLKPILQNELLFQLDIYLSVR